MDLEPDIVHLGPRLGAYLAPETQGRQFVPHGPVPLDFGFGVLKSFWYCFRTLFDLSGTLCWAFVGSCWALGGSFFEAGSLALS